MNNTEAYLKSKREAAKFLSVSLGSIERLMRSGLPYVKVGGLVRFRPEALVAFIEKKTVERERPRTAAGE
jgi:excisionase family DNA binding protein